MSKTTAASAGLTSEQWLTSVGRVSERTPLAHDRVTCADEHTAGDVTVLAVYAVTELPLDSELFHGVVQAAAAGAEGADTFRPGAGTCIWYPAWTPDDKENAIAHKTNARNRCEALLNEIFCI